jgi:Mn-dependent DtxR family transcriptional regulator
VETLPVKILKLLAAHGPLDASSIRRLLGVKYTLSVTAAVRKLACHGLVEGFWLYKLTDKGKAALKHIDRCSDLRCLMREIGS